MRIVYGVYELRENGDNILLNKRTVTRKRHTEVKSQLIAKFQQIYKDKIIEIFQIS